MSPRQKNVVILQSDPSQADLLAHSLKNLGFIVVTSDSVPGLHAALRNQTVNFAVVDLDVVNMTEVASLHQDFKVDVVCTHRCADERMWATALNAGALDCCYPTDVQTITSAISEKIFTAAA